jgi:hypothetical protein
LDTPTYELLKNVASEIPIVQVNAFSNFQFKENLYSLKKWVLADFSELGANRWDTKDTFLWGNNSKQFPHADNEEWGKFDAFVRKVPPIVYFKRELMQKDFGENVHPLNFPCYTSVSAPQTREEFNARPIDVFNSWGYSHELRRMFHGEVFINAVNRNRAVIDNYAHIENEITDKRKKWVSIFTPHYARFDMRDVVRIQGQSKLSVSLPGAGLTCFRHAEACINAVMVMRDDKLKWSYDWIHNVNCIKFPVGEDMDSIRGINGAKEVVESCEKALENPDLYEIYLAGVANCQKYTMPDYIINYVEPIINQYL